ncbi:hypothetical protein P245_20330 [Comamonas thiooxydans]|uniref:Uncharacterized protein n=1 Tax=Comamonas thiooxydans TaxID=363952 RepID=A0A0E3BY86_9BURK|nr:hypothetical protein [Comamonas thiooxydans]KGG87412.1 hypothetical protein P245_20330 [Comamonas thiooxydans]
MEMQHLSNTTSKQVIDSTRTYKELVNVRRSLQRLGGSMLWKPSGKYVYLAQRSYFDSQKVVHLGIRSPETESILQHFETERSRLLQREKALLDRIAIYERMNKAVRAGAASTTMIEAINTLESVGISDDSLWLGTPALHAYWQSTGFETPKTLKEREDIGVYLVFVKRRLDAKTINKLHRCKSQTHYTVSGEHSSVLIIKAETSKHCEYSKKELPGAYEAFAGFLRQHAIEFLDQICEELNQTPTFEQVVIGKTGKMGLMKTVDPHFLNELNTLLGVDTVEQGGLHDLLTTTRFKSKAKIDVI